MGMAEYLCQKATASALHTDLKLPVGSFLLLNTCYLILLCLQPADHMLTEPCKFDDLFHGFAVLLHNYGHGAGLLIFCCFHLFFDPFPDLELRHVLEAILQFGQQPGFNKAVTVPGADDEMVYHFYIEHSAALDEQVGKVFIRGGGQQVAGGVVVYKYNTRGPFLQRYTENLHGFGNGLVNTAHADELYIEYFIGIAEADDPEVLTGAVYFAFPHQYALHDAVHFHRAHHFVPFAAFQFNVHLVRLRDK